MNKNDLGGCLCAFDLTATGGPSGSYQLLDKNGNVCSYTATNCNTAVRAAKYVSAAGHVLQQG